MILLFTRDGCPDRGDNFPACPLVYAQHAIYPPEIMACYPIIIFGRYCNASAKCEDKISSLPAKSAIVRDNLRMR